MAGANEFITTSTVHQSASTPSTQPGDDNGPAGRRNHGNHPIHPVVFAGKENDAPSLVADSSPSQHATPADQHGKASSNAQLALVCHQERHLVSFVEVLRCGLVAAAEGLLGAAMDVVSFGLPTVAEFEDDPAVDSSHSPHDALYLHHVKAPALEVDLDLTPNSITRLSSKYSLDATSLVGPDTITPRGSLADFREGQALDAPRVEPFQTSYRSAKDVIAMQYGQWKQAKSQRQRKSASEISKGSSGTFSSNVVSALAVIRQMVSSGKQLRGVECTVHMLLSDLAIWLKLLCCVDQLLGDMLLRLLAFVECEVAGVCSD
ncbi:hypothetical protein Nepgr_021724 [Nepenthes gracilis]|uniref:Uncharacterized protein n=1 Tax=Nepenthes gracilis TaxID=150966 RepID=A0AAD3SYU7_NEPGR|nr:hypothetical protein Nepgr_021724 [Nepenthes gracilis]